MNFFRVRFFEFLYTLGFKYFDFNKRILGATIEENLSFKHKPYLCFPEEGELTWGVPDPKRGLGEGRGKKPIFIQNTSRVSSVRGVHLEGHTPKGGVQNLIRGDHKGRSKIFQYMQNSDVNQLTEPKLNPNWTVRFQISRLLIRFSSVRFLTIRT